MPTGIPKNGINRGWIKKGSKLSKETKRKIGLKSLGNKHHLGKTGYKHTKEERKKISESKIGKKRNVTWGKNISVALKGKKRPEKFKLIGEKNPNWKGGITSENQKIRHSLEYKLWQKSCLIRDNFTCQKTGQIGGKLVVHHINNFSEFPELRFALDNGITLSKESHISFHKIYGKRNNTREQLIEFLNKKLCV